MTDPDITREALDATREARAETRAAEQRARDLADQLRHARRLASDRLARIQADAAKIRRLTRELDDANAQCDQLTAALATHPDKPGIGARRLAILNREVNAYNRERRALGDLTGRNPQ